jgi:hypothetical protein
MAAAARPQSYTTICLEIGMLFSGQALLDRYMQLMNGQWTPSSRLSQLLSIEIILMVHLSHLIDPSI